MSTKTVPPTMANELAEPIFLTLTDETTKEHVRAMIAQLMKVFGTDDVRGDTKFRSLVADPDSDGFILAVERKVQPGDQ